MNIAGVPPYKSRILNFVSYLKQELVKYKVDIHLHHRFDIKDLDDSWAMIVKGWQPRTKPKELPFLV